MMAGRYIPDPHFEKRCLQRHFSVFDGKRIAATATTCVPLREAEILALLIQIFPSPSLLRSSPAASLLG
jgi:hypothetical protein